MARPDSLSFSHATEEIQPQSPAARSFIVDRFPARSTARHRLQGQHSVSLVSSAEPGSPSPLKSDRFNPIYD